MSRKSDQLWADRTLYQHIHIFRFKANYYISAQHTDAAFLGVWPALVQLYSQLKLDSP